MIVYRLSESGRVCSGDYSSYYTSLDFDPSKAMFYEQSYEKSEGLFFYVLSVFFFLLIGFACCAICCVISFVIL